MTQADVLKVMEKYPDKSFTTEDLRKILKLKAVKENLRRLYLNGDVKRVLISKRNKQGNEYLYSLK